jgi:drug/metabolite transporter (DMT)-like permease
LIGRFFLNEQITPSRWMGTLLIVAGTILVGLSQPQTTPKEETPAAALAENRA